jgi:hypothetical protein
MPSRTRLAWLGESGAIIAKSGTPTGLVKGIERHIAADPLPTSARATTWRLLVMLDLGGPGRLNESRFPLPPRGTKGRMRENPYQAPEEVGELPRRTSLAQFTAYGIHYQTHA